MDTDREKFEAAMRNRLCAVANSGNVFDCYTSGSYKYTGTITAWEAWQAAIKASQDVVSEAVAWQPFETAPKDGKWYLFYKKGSVASARWDGECFEGDGWFYGFPESIAKGITENLPTHWMPMPAPPNAAIEKDKP